MEHKRKSQNGSNAEYHLTLNQLKRILAACRNQRDTALIQVLAFTGIRRAEAASLRSEDVRWNEQLLLIQHGKGRKQRLVPMPDFVLDNLKSLIDKQTGDAIFQNRTGTALSSRQLNRIVAGIGKAAGVRNPNPKYRNITCHLFRHTFARLWKDKNGSIESLSRILGHSSVKTTWDLYGTEAISDVQRNYKEVMRKIEIGRNTR